LKSGRGIGEQDKIDQTKPVGGEPVPPVNLQGRRLFQIKPARRQFAFNAQNFPEFQVMKV